MLGRNGHLYINDGIIFSPSPTYTQSYTTLEEKLKQFHPRTIRYLEPGKSFTSATVILMSNVPEEEVQHLPSGIYAPRLPRMGVLKNYGFRSPETGEVYPDSALDAFRHLWFNGLSIYDHQKSLKCLKELITQNQNYIVALALAAINPKPEGREIRIRMYGTEKQLEGLLKELEGIPLAGRCVEVMKPSLGKEGLGNDGLYVFSD